MTKSRNNKARKGQTCDKAFRVSQLLIARTRREDRTTVEERDVGVCLCMCETDGEGDLVCDCVSSGRCRGSSCQVAAEGHMGIYSFHRVIAAVG